MVRKDLSIALLALVSLSVACSEEPPPSEALASNSSTIGSAQADPCGDLGKKHCSKEGNEKACKYHKASIAKAKKDGTLSNFKKSCEATLKSWAKYKAAQEEAKKMAEKARMAILAAAAKGASSQRGQQFDYDKECKLNEILDAPKKDTPEHALHQLFVHWKKAVDTGWKGSRGDLADSWRELFSAGDSYLREINNSLINLVRKKKKIDQYLISGKKGVAVKLCQRRISDEKVKFYIWNNSKDSNPPVDVERDPEDGTWKLKLSFSL